MVRHLARTARPPPRPRAVADVGRRRSMRGRLQRSDGARRRRPYRCRGCRPRSLLRPAGWRWRGRCRCRPRSAGRGGLKVPSSTMLRGQPLQCGGRAPRWAGHGTFPRMTAGSIGLTPTRSTAGGCVVRSRARGRRTGRRRFSARYCRSPLPRSAARAADFPRRCDARTRYRPARRGLRADRLGCLAVQRLDVVAQEPDRQAVVSSCGTTGSPPPRTSATKSGHAGGSWKLKPTEVRPNRACAARQSGSIAASSAAKARQASGCRISPPWFPPAASSPGCPPARRVLGEVLQDDRTVGPLQQAQCVPQDAQLEAGSSGSPTGRPSGAAVHRARGGRVLSACARTAASATVAKPLSSSMWASAHTARVQRGQTGLSRTESIRSCRSCPAICSTASAIAAGSVDPITV